MIVVSGEFVFWSKAPYFILVATQKQAEPPLLVKSPTQVVVEEFDIVRVYVIVWWIYWMAIF